MADLKEHVHTTKENSSTDNTHVTTSTDQQCHILQERPEAKNVSAEACERESSDKLDIPIITKATKHVKLCEVAKVGHKDELSTLTVSSTPILSSVYSETMDINKKARIGSLLKPLSFPENTTTISSCFLSPETDLPIYCLLCSETFGLKASPVTVPESTSSKKSDQDEGVLDDEVIAQKPLRLKLTPRDDWLRHLLTEHKIVVHNVKEICSLKCYSEYWKRRLTQGPITEFAPVIRTNTYSEFPSETYYLLSESVPEDKSLRVHLHRSRLEAILELQQNEREETSFSRRCLFCSQFVTGNRRDLFQHMLDSHGFNVGQPDNLVFVTEFLDLLQNKLDSLQCLFCERTFRDRSTLKDHMRKKGHKKIDSQNKIYDRFYVINYLEFGKGWQQVQSEDDRESGFVEESEWTECSTPLNDSVYCLFCLSPLSNTESALTHMRDTHNFDLPSLCVEMSLDYYGQVKIVNYIRRKVHINSCVYCSKQCQSMMELVDHMSSSCHFMLPSNRALWDQSQYLFPTYENDSLLCGLDDEQAVVEQ